MGNYSTLCENVPSSQFEEVPQSTNVAESEGPESTPLPSDIDDVDGTNANSKIGRLAWTFKDTLCLLDAKKSLDLELKDGTLMQKSRSSNARWNSVVDYCKRRGVFKSASQCRNKWEKILKLWKPIYNRERNSPSGQSEYWLMTTDERKDAGLPISFQRAIYEAMVMRFGYDKANDTSTITITADTSRDAPRSGASAEVDDGHPRDALDGISDCNTMENHSSGKKRKIGGYCDSSTQELLESSKALLRAFEKYEENHLLHAREVARENLELLKQNVDLTKERLKQDKEMTQMIYQGLNSMANAISSIANAMTKK